MVTDDGGGVGGLDGIVGDEQAHDDVGVDGDHSPWRSANFSHISRAASSTAVPIASMATGGSGIGDAADHLAERRARDGPPWPEDDDVAPGFHLELRALPASRCRSRTSFGSTT